MENINLLITIDSALVHLAGVLNIPTLLLLGNGSDWRWSNVDECYWFENVTIMRSKSNNDLKTILSDVKPKIQEISRQLIT